MNEVTRIFARIENGEATATDELFTFVYEELKRLHVGDCGTSDRTTRCRLRPWCMKPT